MFLITQTKSAAESEETREQTNLQRSYSRPSAALYVLKPETLLLTQEVLNAGIVVRCTRGVVLKDKTLDSKVYRRCSKTCRGRFHFNTVLTKILATSYLAAVKQTDLDQSNRTHTHTHTHTHRHTHTNTHLHTYNLWGLDDGKALCLLCRLCIYCFGLPASLLWSCKQQVMFTCSRIILKRLQQKAKQRKPR
jgi:hypothetical protein